MNQLAITRGGELFQYLNCWGKVRLWQGGSPDRENRVLPNCAEAR